MNLRHYPSARLIRFSLTSLWAGNIQIRTIGYGESYINATGLRHVWHLRCTDTLKGPLLESYEICPNTGSGAGSARRFWSTLRSGLARYVSGWRKLHRLKRR
ncbi:hydrogenase expression/formation C-terminal domain-containing protein [Shigella flexneri]